MNQKFKEIANQVKLPAWATDDSTSVNIAEKLEEFAKIIINECIKQCEPETGIKYSPNSLSARQDCSEKIKNYFELE